MALSPNNSIWYNSEVEPKNLWQGKTRMEFDSLTLNGELAFGFEFELAFSG